MRRFTPEYLERTRRGLWDSRAALSGLDLGRRERVLDVGCGSGQLTRVLEEETPADATVVGCDAATDLLSVARAETDAETVAGDATRLPFPDDRFDCVVCQALLINLPDPAAAVREFARVSTDVVAAVEPNNAEVSVSSTVDAESELEARVRRAYLDGINTDVALGERVRSLFESAGLSPSSGRTRYHEKRVAPPYSEAALRSAAKKASGEGLAAHERELRTALSDGEYDALRTDWREMGRAVVAAMGDGEYERVEVVPFEVTVGEV
ncbi:MAG: class I SAM-dependent methyltransferase [Halolamina sp.]